MNRLLNEQAVRLNAQYDDLRKTMHDEIDHMYQESENMRSAYDLRINQLEEVIKRYTQNILQQDNQILNFKSDLARKADVEKQLATARNHES